MTAKRDKSMDIGVIFGELETPGNCSCHISPPCAACVRNREPVDEARSWSLIVDDGDEDRYIHYVYHSQYAALEAENTSLRQSLAALEKERDELRERLTISSSLIKTLSDAVVFAEDYISLFELENDISKPEFLYIRDAAKCLREPDCV